ncbi:MAG TPA: DNA methyltransferase [Dehalococcoidia bacterium]|nr:DNA methyltransferase [Dehalococcoidia bacterium]
METKTNVLYFGDNLEILRDYIPDESVDLIYLDPPFNSNRSYNVLFKETSSEASQAQIEAFEDTWHWGKVAQNTFEDMALRGADDTARLLKAMVDALGHNDVTAYLTMMAVRLVELKRVLKTTGSLYLHCDPSASHYLKTLMDSIFGPQNFRNEIIWKRSSAHSDSAQGAKHFGRVSDTILFYSKSASNKWSQQYAEYDPDYVASNYKRRDADGRLYRIDNIQGPGGAAKGNPRYEFLGVTRYWRYSRERMHELYEQGRIIQTRPGAVPQYKRYLDEMPGLPIQNIWTDIPIINNRSKELLGYPTQKPLALLERIISTSSDEGDIVLDPFCGCGTAVHAAQKLGRKWIGIDITHLAIGLVRRRMEDAFAGLNIEVVGEPVDLSGAQELAANDPYQFQWWAIDRIDAQPVGDKKKGMDRGIDGIIPFLESRTDRKRVIVSVKGGGISSKDMRDLIGVLEREGEPIGVLVTLRPPTREMQLEAVKAGHYESSLMGRKYPRIQILTIADILNGKKVEMPPRIPIFAEPAVEPEPSEQPGLI